VRWGHYGGLPEKRRLSELLEAGFFDGSWKSDWEDG
jgi:hypothetical protein